MIINHPTGLYNLPKSPSDSASVTYTISNTSPVRSDLLYPQIPKGIELRGQDRDTVDQLAAHYTMGKLAISTSSAGRTISGNNYGQYIIGDILEFANNEVVAAEPMLVSKKTEIQFNLVSTDFKSLNITDTEKDQIIAAVAKARIDFTKQLNDAKNNRANKEIEIASLQKTLNDVNRSISVLTSIGSSIAMDKLVEAKSSIESQISDAIVAANEYAAEADNIATRLKQLQVIA